MSTPPRTDAQVQAFADAFNAGVPGIAAAMSIGLSCGSAGRLKADAIARGMIDPSARDWRPIKRTTATNADGDVTGIFLQERPDTGVTPCDTSGMVPTRVTVHTVGGEVNQTWEQFKPDAAAQANGLRIFAETLAEPVRGLAPVVVRPSHTDDDLMVVYPVGDPHFGLYSYADETGEDFDLAEAERVTCAAVDRLVATAPNASTGYFLILGDTTHADDSTNATPGHGHPLDVDTRFGKVMRVTARAMRWSVRRLLEKHAHVIVRFVPGNHDPHVSVALGLIVEAYFDGDPRVSVETTAAAHSYVVFGQCLIGTHHGDKTRFSDLPGVMATDRAKDWGNATFRTWLCGHVHHSSVKEYPGCTVETFRTLAAKDAWHAGKGYRSGRDLNAITYHRDFGEIHRSRCDISMLRAA
jgi:hypothetical protein